MYVISSGKLKMNVQIFLLLLSCVLGEPGEPPAEAAKVAAEETNAAVDVETEKAGETVTEQPAGVNITVTPEAELKNSTEETIDSIVLPEAGSAAKEHSSSLAIFFLLFVLILCIFLIHLLLRIKFHYLPESLAIVFLGAVVGMFMMALPEAETKRMEAFSPTMFFLVLLPPIIFESGYNLHKGNFFQNIGSIMVFAILGTAISALVVGGGVYLLGLADVVYKLDFIQSFAFGSLISAVDPVATLAIFQALDVEPVLNMLVFGESILNDAVAIVLTTTIIESGGPEMADIGVLSQIGSGITRFFGVFFGSAAIGTLVAMTSALVLKQIDLYTNPSLEFALMLCFIYTPYALAEGVHLSGIMAILFCGVVMSHYTHYNLSPVTQITMQQTMRTLAFVCESSIFIYLGLGIFSFPHRVELSLVVWALVLILVGRALNIFPLSLLCNKFRSHQITKRMMVIMWFSGLRGAIAYALSLHLEFEDQETRKVLVTTTLIVVLFTTIVLGGGTMPLMKYLESKSSGRNRRRRKKDITLSKTSEFGSAIDSEHLSELTEEELEQSFAEGRTHLQGFMYWDYKFLRPFFVRKFSQQELKDGKSHVTKLTDKWSRDIQSSPLVSDLSDMDMDLNIDMD
eukprot:TRINITY_DN12692_c0_g1_i1.p1 TRINITY_DN12692_c0_g1~~TRINITY_DN12692_c0_g1_i1.p1  ORF type:complete len:628 (-),score=203.27 TRINITY_DN12692_c0_g1_i1:152-2035(-)